MRKAGFTVIELLVSMVIIGLIAGIILAALTNSRNKARDAAVKDNLENIRTQAALYYDKHGHYGGGIAHNINSCLSGPVNMFNSDPTIANMILGAEDNNGSSGVWCTTDLDNWYADQFVREWSIQSALWEGGIWCVDSTGASRKVTSDASTGLCPPSP